ncbi:MAG: tetratricopeptide repeat protein, partial [Candidatus Babeliales bacterium]|nr:tetratricopeptide repeat protein [Candidatus Babeliales bacterium]
MKQQSQMHEWLYAIIPPVILSCITACVYYPSLNYEFQFDDIANISKHFNIRHNTFSSLWFTGTRWISYWLNAIHYSIGNFDPFSYRVGNVMIHTVNGLLIFFIIKTALAQLKKESFFKTNAFSIACMTSLLFLIHPVQTQTVSYVIQGQLEGLAALFILGMSLCLLKYTAAKDPVVRFVLSLSLFALAVFSCGTKEIALISPALLVLVDWFFIAQGNWPSLKQRLSVHASLLAVITGIYVWLLKPAFFTKIFTLGSVAKNNIGNVITQDPNAAITPWHFLISQFKVVLHYMWMFIWPFDISVEYDWMLVKGFFAPDCIFPLMILLLLSYGVYRLLRHDKANVIAFGALWFAICMAPRSSIIASPELLVDYKTYTASFGILLLLAIGLVYAFTKLIKIAKNVPVLSHQKFGVVALTCLFAVPLSIQTVRRNTVWRSGIEFWENIIQNAPGKARAYNNYGVELSQKKHQFKEAVPYFQKAIAMDAKYPDPCNNLAVAYSHLGRTDDAIAALKHSLDINPYYPEGYNNLASFFIQKKELDKAEQCLNIALKIRPYYGKAFFNMGRIYVERGDQEKAWQCFKDSCTKADLDTDIGYATYGRVSLSLGKYDDAIFGLTKALELNRDYPEA